MNTAKHTPGPWDSDAGVVWSQTEKDSEGRSKIICRVARKNQKIIAAAPELLEVCKAIDEHCAGGGIDGNGLNLRKQLQTAIAKAEGRA